MDLSAYLDLFVAEAREHIGAAAELAATVDETPDGRDQLRELFRHVHSVKGMAASMGFGAMTGLAHDAESLMDELRQGRMTPRRHTRNVLCDALSCLERMVDRAEARQDVDDADRAPLQERLREALQSVDAASAAGARADTGGSSAPAGVATSEQPAGCVKLSLIVGRDRPFPAVRAAVVLGQLAKLGRLVRTEPPMAALRSGRFDGRLQALLVTELTPRSLAAKVAAMADVDSFSLVPAESPREKAEPQPPKASLRVRADRLDTLIDDVLELMAALGRAGSGLASKQPGPAVASDVESARLLARHAYDGLVEMRLVPFEVAMHRLRRAADQLSRKLGKSVTLEIDGENVRIDRSLLEKLIDPLLHMVRNAIDHGIETESARRAAGKPAAGRLAIRIARQASRLTVVVEDDGPGLDVRRLKEVAIERGVLTPSQAVRLSDTEALNLITTPGFSTLDDTSEVSGRGVGMDVVRGAVEAIGGHLRIETRLGHGTRFELALPPTVALVESYVVRAGAQLFAVPLAAMKRMAPTDDQSTSWRDGRRFCDAGGESVPLWSLREILGLGAAPAGVCGIAMIGSSTSDRELAIEVDEVVGKREIVIRPLPPLLAGLPWYSGAAVLDDGTIVLAIDPSQLPLS